jgi:hypothetical protein
MLSMVHGEDAFAVLKGLLGIEDSPDDEAGPVRLARYLHLTPTPGPYDVGVERMYPDAGG